MRNNPLSSLFKKKEGCVFKLINKLSTVEDISFSFNKEFDIDSRWKKTRFGRFELQDNFYLKTGFGCVMHSGATLVVYSGAKIILGNNVLFNNNCEVCSSCLIKIGDNSIFSNNDN